MAKPRRHSALDHISAGDRTFFVTTATWGRRRLLQTDRMAGLLVDTLIHYRDEHHFRLHDFVVMPDHLHVLLTVGPAMTVEKAAQLIKGGFSYRASREFGLKTAIWERGFSEVRILTEAEFRTRSRYIRENPVRAGLASAPELYRYSSANGAYRLDPSPFSAAKAAGVSF